MKKFVLFEEAGSFNVQRYASRKGAASIHLFGESGPLATLTVNEPDVQIPKGCILMKNYSENEGIPTLFEKQGFGEIVDYAPAGRSPTGIAIVKVTEPTLIAAIEAVFSKDVKKEAPASKGQKEPSM